MRKRRFGLCRFVFTTARAAGQHATAGPDPNTDPEAFVLASEAQRAAEAQLYTPSPGQRTSDAIARP